MGRFDNFIGGTYAGRLGASDRERSINLYPEIVGSAGAADKSPAVLLSKPGLSPFLAQRTGGGSITGHGALVSATLYAVCSHYPQAVSGFVYSTTGFTWGQNSGWPEQSWWNIDSTNHGPATTSVTYNTSTHAWNESEPGGWGVYPDYTQTIVSFFMAPALSWSGPEEFRIHDVYILATYADSTVVTLRPTEWQVTTAAHPTASYVQNPTQAIDADPNSYASMWRSAWPDTLDFTPTLQFRNFAPAVTSRQLPDVLGTQNSSAVRALCEINGRLFAIAASGADNIFFEIYADGTFTRYNSLLLAGDARPQMVASQTQVLVLSGGNGYVFDLRANTLALVSAAGFPVNAVKATYLDGYFVVLWGNTQKFSISALNDATSWNTLDFGTAEGEPGNVVSIIADHRQLWFLSNTHGEIYYDSGNATFPFSRLEGAHFEQGAAAIDSLVRFDNSIIWLGRNADGSGVVWKAAGYTPQRISNHAIEARIAAIARASRIDDATAYVYQDAGHTFYVLHFPSAPTDAETCATFVYDAAAGVWHERGYWDSTHGTYVADLARVHAFAFGRHIVGDWQSGALYEMSSDYATDNGGSIRRVRSAPDLSNGGKFVFYSEFRLLMEVGVGLDGGVTPGSDPQISLQVSNDGGATWGNERAASMGKQGQYSTLVRWRRLGRSNNRAFRVVCSEPVSVGLISADIDAEAAS